MPELCSAKKLVLISDRIKKLTFDSSKTKFVVSLHFNITILSPFSLLFTKFITKITSEKFLMNRIDLSLRQSYWKSWKTLLPEILCISPLLWRVIKSSIILGRSELDLFFPTFKFLYSSEWSFKIYIRLFLVNMWRLGVLPLRKSTRILEEQ